MKIHHLDSNLTKKKFLFEKFSHNLYNFFFFGFKHKTVDNFNKKVKVSNKKIKNGKEYFTNCTCIINSFGLL